MKIGSLDLGEFPVLLAPLEDITDSAFRVICREFGAAMVYTEFISSEGLVRDARKSNDKLLFEECERPIGIQIFGSDPEAMRLAALRAAEAKPEVIDINFGCPVKKVAMKGAGAGLLNDVSRMVKITGEVVKATSIPVTVKTRLGWDDSHKNIVEIAERLQDEGIAAITIHGRTRAQLYSGTADWTLIGEVKNNPRMSIPVIGNGDIDKAEKVFLMKEKYGVDAVMIGRAAIGNPWIFKEISGFRSNRSAVMPATGIGERVSVCLRHLHKAVENKGEHRAVVEMRRHYAGYFRGMYDFKKYRIQLLTLKSESEIIGLLSEIKQNYPDSGPE
ncbi:MAG TPA: tRNA dihydrouridine synthase DusB [Bacteroidales bacterium]|nr:tRNA dihydrouridine synthase DusB [Bacteroidales bacterium]HPT02961.1 tRNA dihydrouridine synthase DusB [Bacteroidales bacterium]